MSQLVRAVFVYGTLQRGELRERCWPRQPLRIEWATVQGELRDLGEYPALLSGTRLILGELWTFAEVDMDITLAVLDEIECYAQNDDDLYLRKLVACRTLCGDPRQAHAYLFAHPEEIVMSPIVLPDVEGFCRWTSRRGTLSDDARGR